MAYEFRTLRRVEFADTDMAGIVHFSAFFRYMESVEHAFFRSLGLSISMTVDGKPVGFPRVHAECDFFSPLRFEEEVELHLLVREIRSRSVVYDVVMTHVDGEKRRPVARGSLIAACVVKAADGSLKSTPLPDCLLEKIEEAPPPVLERLPTLRTGRRDGNATGGPLDPPPERPQNPEAPGPAAPPKTRAEIARDQLHRLRRLLAKLRENPFYRPRLKAAGLGRGVESLEEFRRCVPPTTREELLEDQIGNPPFGTNLTYPPQRYTRVHATSGTSTTPLRWPDTPESWQWLLESWKVVFRAAGVGPGDRVFFGFSFGPFLGLWTAFEAAAQMGVMCLPGGGLNSSARLNVILENKATVLCCTPTYAVRLAEVAQQEGIDLSAAAVRRIIVAGEPGGSVPAVRSRIESLWPGARVFDHHGMTEVGPVSYECPARPCTLRVNESAYLAEVVDPESLQQVEEGTVGELILTPLGRDGSPLLRYRTGDLVRPVYLNAVGDAPGPFLSLDGGVLGRADDMVLVRGVNVFPSAVDQIVRSDSRVAEYRVDIDSSKSLTQMSVSVEPFPGCSEAADLAATLEAAFRRHLSLRVPVRMVEPGTLPRFELKARRWVKN